ncbi:flagellar FliJ family protein [bacterium]|nr:flagellar FliJ family protein [bacterium]MBU1073042.1 flagellar FliJ family protein [bacterium]MBU1674560.1 flagellar FliJ family protein [bacterium]
MFRFKLSKVLRYRRRRLEAEARKLHAIESAAQALERENARMAKRCRELALAEQPAVTSAVLGHKRRLTEFTRGQGLMILRNEEEVRSIRKRADVQRRILLAAQRDKRVLELLRDRHLAAWTLRQRRLEQKRTDEIASRGSCR